MSAKNKNSKKLSNQKTLDDYKITSKSPISPNSEEKKPSKSTVKIGHNNESSKIPQKVKAKLLIKDSSKELKDSKQIASEPFEASDRGSMSIERNLASKKFMKKKFCVDDYLNAESLKKKVKKDDELSQLFDEFHDVNARATSSIFKSFDKIQVKNESSKKNSPQKSTPKSLFEDEEEKKSSEKESRFERTFKSPSKHNSQSSLPDDINSSIKNVEIDGKARKKQKEESFFNKVTQLIARTKSIPSREYDSPPKIAKQTYYLPLNRAPYFDSSNLAQLKELAKNVSEYDIARLDPDTYLNDSLINFYLKFIELGLISEERRKELYIFNTYFMTKIREKLAKVDNNLRDFDQVYESVQRWTKKSDLFEKKFILIPIHELEHWNMAIICYPERLYSNDELSPMIFFLDSNGTMDFKIGEILFLYLEHELRNKKKEEYRKYEIKLRRTKLRLTPYQFLLPKQYNQYDCGLYLLMYAELFAADELYIMRGLEDSDRIRWFPKSVIGIRRLEIKNIISELKNPYSYTEEVIENYLSERDQEFNRGIRLKDINYDVFPESHYKRRLKEESSFTKELDEEEKHKIKLCVYYDEPMID